jgi:hypothetical protein
MYNNSIKLKKPELSLFPADLRPDSISIFFINLFLSIPFTLDLSEGVGSFELLSISIK